MNGLGRQLPAKTRVWLAAQRSTESCSRACRWEHALRPNPLNTATACTGAMTLPLCSHQPPPYFASGRSSVEAEVAWRTQHTQASVPETAAASVVPAVVALVPALVRRTGDMALYATFTPRARMFGVGRGGQTGAPPAPPDCSTANASHGWPLLLHRCRCSRLPHTAPEVPPQVFAHH